MDMFFQTLGVYCLKQRTMYQLLEFPIGLGLLLSGLIGPMLLYGFITNGSNAQGNWDLVIFISFTSILSPIALVFWWRKYRTLEIEIDGADRQSVTGRKSNQCSICKKHPISKKYHLSTIHNLKNVKTMDYFIDCGCENCQQFGYFGN